MSSCLVAFFLLVLLVGLVLTGAIHLAAEL